MGWDSKNPAYADTFLRGRGYWIYRGSDEDAHDGSHTQAV